MTAHGVPVVGPLDTWCDLGAYAVGHRRSVTVGDLVMIGDAILMCLLETQHPLASREESRDQDVVVGLLRQFTRVLARRVRPRGKTALATAYDLLRVGVRSPQESRARVLMVLSGLPEPAINVPIHSNDGSALLAEGDLVWDTEDREGGRRKVVGEYQGAYHAERDQRSRDSERSERLRDHGWTVHEIWAEDINQVERRWNLVLRIARSLGLPPSGLTPIRWL